MSIESRLATIRQRAVGAEKALAAFAATMPDEHLKGLKDVQDAVKAVIQAVENARVSL